MSWMTLYSQFLVYMTFCNLSSLKEGNIGPILDDRLKEKLLKPWKFALCSHFHVCLSVCLSVRPRATEHTFWPRNLIFGLSDPWDMRKKQIFLFFEIFIFTLFIGIFFIFSLYNTSKFLVSSYRSQFFT